MFALLSRCLLPRERTEQTNKQTNKQTKTRAGQENARPLEPNALHLRGCRRVRLAAVAAAVSSAIGFGVVAVAVAVAISAAAAAGRTDGAERRRRRGVGGVGQRASAQPDGRRRQQHSCEHGVPSAGGATPSGALSRTATSKACRAFRAALQTRCATRWVATCRAAGQRFPGSVGRGRRERQSSPQQRSSPPASTPPWPDAASATCRMRRHVSACGATCRHAAPRVGMQCHVSRTDPV